MQSPEVIQWLHGQQKLVEEEHQRKPATLPKERTTSKTMRSVEPLQGSSDVVTFRTSSEGGVSDEASSTGAVIQGPSGDDESDGGESQKIISHSIWSREASAFSSVTRTNQTKWLVGFLHSGCVCGNTQWDSSVLGYTLAVWHCDNTFFYYLIHARRTHN